MKLNFPKLKILLIGDFMIDHYLFGSSTRVSPEAPIPVVNFEEEKFVPGGAGNVAMNLKSFGTNVSCAGYIGDDSWGEILLKILKENEIDTRFIDIKSNYTTICKQRIYSESIQQSRLDYESLVSDWVPSKEIDYENFDIIILSDYNKGIFSKNWFNVENIPVILDPKKCNPHIFKYSKIITPNLKELSEITNSKISNINSLEKAANKLIDEYQIEHVVITKGDAGISLVSKNENSKHFDAYKVENPDVTGAGDTVISALACLYAETGNIENSVKIANAAAAVAVQNKGTHKINIHDIEKLLNSI